MHMLNFMDMLKRLHPVYYGLSVTSTFCCRMVVPFLPFVGISDYPSMYDLCCTQKVQRTHNPETCALGCDQGFSNHCLAHGLRIFLCLHNSQTECAKCLDSVHILLIKCYYRVRNSVRIHSRNDFPEQK